MVDDEGKQYEGTGFLSGDGWVMTAAHNLQDDKERHKGIHNFLLNASFKVTFHVPTQDGNMKEYKFLKRKRTAFAHHLQPGGCSNLKDKDIAMVKLGSQYDYARREEDYEDWEKREKELLHELHQFVRPFSSEVTTEPITRGSSVYAVYYHANGADHEKEFEKITVKRNSVSLIQLVKKRGVLRAGTSGCPILAEKGEVGEYTLAGLHFCGDDDNKDGKAYALPWDKSIQGFVTKGTYVILDIEAYLALKELPVLGAQERMEKERQELEKMAKNNNLTIYMFDGTVIPSINEQPLWGRCCCQ